MCPPHTSYLHIYDDGDDDTMGVVNVERASSEKKNIHTHYMAQKNQSVTIGHDY